MCACVCVCEWECKRDCVCGNEAGIQTHKGAKQKAIKCERGQQNTKDVFT